MAFRSDQDTSLWQFSIFQVSQNLEPLSKLKRNATFLSSGPLSQLPFNPQRAGARVLPPRVGPNIGRGMRHWGPLGAVTSVDWTGWKRPHRPRSGWQQKPQDAALFHGNITGLQIPEWTPKRRNANMTQAALQTPGPRLPTGLSMQPTRALCPE